MSITLETAIAPEIRSEIYENLERIEADNDVRILFAVESGSRAWGFPSPDSDYDVRFIYVHKRDWYLSIQDHRDVIELPISDELDIGGWELRKALRLLLKPNPVMLEWLSSPIRYIWRDQETELLDGLSKKLSNRNACIFHYTALGSSQWKKYLENVEEVKLKKYFYTLRPAMALRWMRLNAGFPPMNMQELMQGCELLSDETDLINVLIEQKRETKEMGYGKRYPLIDDFILRELSWGDEVDKPKASDDLWQEADQVFREILMEVDK